MLPVILGLAAIAALASCGDDKAKRVPVPNPPPPTFPDHSTSSGDKYLPRHDLGYEKTCLMNDTCEPQQALAALMDYANAAYAKEQSSLNFDGQLELQERDYVEELFGALTGDQPQEIEAWYLKAQKQALSKYLTPQNDHPRCNIPENWEILQSKKPDRNLGNAYVLASVHDCFTVTQRLLYTLGWEGIIANQPQDWLFLIEDAKLSEVDQRLGKKTRDNETALLDHITQVYDIPVHNSLIPVDDERTLAAMEKKGYERLQIVAYLFITRVSTDQYLNPETRNKMSRYSPAQINKMFYEMFEDIFMGEAYQTFEKDIEKFTKVLGVEKNEFLNYCRTMWQHHGGKDKTVFFTEVLKEINEMFREQLETSNELSTKYIQKTVQESGRSNTLIQLGSNHIPAVQQAYQNLEERKVKWR